MSNVNATLTAIIHAGVTGLAQAVATSHKLDSQILGSTHTVSLVAAFRMGREWAKGETAEDKVNKFPNAFGEFQNNYIAAGNPVFRDSDGLDSFRAIKSALRRKELVGGPQVRAYIADCRAQKLTKKEHAIGEVQSLAKKIFEDTRDNHADVVRRMAALDDMAAVMEIWIEHVKRYGSSVTAIKAYFKKEPAEGEAADPIAAATKKLLALTDAAELTAIVKRLQSRIDEMTSTAIIATKLVNNAVETVEAEEVERIAA